MSIPTMRLARRLLAAGMLLGAAAPAAAQQGGIFQQPYQRNPFALLLDGGVSVTGSFNFELSNNTLEVGDLWAINEIVSADDDSLNLRPSDLFLIGGLVPEGEGVELMSRGQLQLNVTFPTRVGTFGLTFGGYGHAESIVPDEVAKLVREGFEGDTFTVDLTELGATTIAFGDVGALGLFDLPLDVPALRLRVGLGMHYLYGIGYNRVRFNGDAGELGTSGISVSHEGLDADLLISMPTEAVEPGGSGFAADFFASLDVGERINVSALVARVGSIRATRGEREVRRLVLRDTTVAGFLEALDSLDTTSCDGAGPTTPCLDTIPASTEEIALPGLLRFEASYRLHRMVAAGLVFEQMLGYGFTVDPVASGLTGLVEFRPLGFLPIRVGGTLENGFEAGFQFGGGLLLGPVHLDCEFASRGGIGATSKG
ncbi:MAG: hypothetical protein HY561_12755, partial [Gemmatimonadetes bacterium]|nr:hypothetical protein [Gemmatimonadota bacterium]